MTGEPNIMPLFLEIAATPPKMRRAITEACNCLLEGMGPSFTELRRYLNEINDPSADGSKDFSDIWTASGQPGTPAGVLHFLSADRPESRKALNDIISMGLGSKLMFVDDNDATIAEKESLDETDRAILNTAASDDYMDIGTVASVLDTVPNCAMAVLSQKMGEWDNSDERNLTIPETPEDRRVVNGWLVHNSDNADDIYNEGFLIGNPIGYLAYGKKGELYDDRYGFSYRLQDAPPPYNKYGTGLTYTSSDRAGSIVFMGSGNVVDHRGDREKQVIFDIHEPTGCFLVKPCETEWGVYGKNPYRPLVSGLPYRECLDWIQENGWQYRNQVKEWDNRWE